MEIFKRIVKFVVILLVLLLLISVITAENISNDANNLNISTAFVDSQKMLNKKNDNSLIPIIDNVRIIPEHYPVYVDGVTYLPIDFVREYFNDDFYWDDEENILTLTTIKEVIRMKTDDLTYYVNDEPLDLNIPVKKIDEYPYIPLALLEKFVDFRFKRSDIGTLVIEDKQKGKNVSYVKNNSTPVRELRDDRTDIVQLVNKQDELKVLEKDKIWVKVITKDGLLGYVKLTEINRFETLEGEPSTKEIYDYKTRRTFDGGLNLTWHYVGNPDANAFLDEKLEGVHSLDVISPTWFHFKNPDGTLTNIADLNYVREAHARGIQVWALFSNKFDKELTSKVLASTSARENVIKQLLYFANLYELDGINVDFENVGKEDGENFIQFMKELTPYLKAQDLVVSVDTYVPRSWTAHYGRKTLGEIVDYVMVMTYDEHWSTSPEAGSVASLPFVDDGIKKTLEEVPNDKVVLGLPYYTRIWKIETVNGEKKLTSEAVSMDFAYREFVKNGVQFKWLDDIGQFYGEYEEEGITYKLWLEDVSSIEQKMSVYEKYDLAGVASWQVGMENDKVWDVLKQYLGK